MTAYVFPGQGAQFPGMGKSLFDVNEYAQTLFKQADEVLGFSLSKVMFEGSEEELLQTRITQPAIFVHSAVTYLAAEETPNPDAVAGHSLGEFSALVAAGAIAFPDALRLVSQRAQAMQEAADRQEGAMAAVLGLDDAMIEEACARIDDIVVPANYNSPGQLVISGSREGVERASKILSDLGARKVIPLKVGGAFHSPLMEPAREKLQEAIEATHFRPPGCDIYQNVDGGASVAPEKIKEKLIRQLTAPVRWTQTVQQMQANGIDRFVEVGGKGKVLAGLIKKVDRHLTVDQME
ncbi:[acyl-carrier-protein] S-malonyltransferase [Neolewinella xylanilytica]|uniref:Malonyl CoA-acyl carrier protein transacylase n=1 Tax=Neolewinella xylanilytica TaxID=1514080 RepID=A0A2S6I5K6_9BACT|nr:ACP S-malonyltransferase [Neolewinella xylanilytica]PPK86448.1 [acyl-carrier-protein] S-malonyltransferase [Neolewinella xylanilytica]